MQAIIVGGRKISKASANEVSAEFDRIRAKRGGRLTPQAVVNAARHKASPLHRYFEWSDRLAGEKHRLSQASELIRSVRVTIRADPNDKPRTIRALVSVVTPRGREYVPAVEAMTAEEFRDQMLADALRELHAFRSKYRQLSALAVVFAAIEKVQRPRKRAA